MGGEIPAGAAARLIRLFDEDTQAGRFQLIPIGKDILEQTIALAARCYHAQEPVLLQTLDGIRLATARLLKCRSVATADGRMRQAAASPGFTLEGC